MNQTWNFSVNNSQKRNENVDIEFIKQEIGQRFPFYDMRIMDQTLAFYCTIDSANVDSLFDDLRKILSQKGYVSFLRHERGEDIIYVTKKPFRKEKSIWINIILLIATIITTMITGSLLHIGVSDLQSLENIWSVLYPENLLFGTFYFSFPLLSILFIHEMGHYFISKKHGIHTSLPFFLPIPPIVPGFNIGTFGALISSHDPMPNKKALFDVGISGPLAGFIVAIPVTIIGLITSDLVAVGSIVSGETILGSSLLFELLTSIFVTIPEGFALTLNPIAFAGWIGLLITSINLLPAGQLDGGHIFRAIFGDKQKYAGWIAVFIMVFTGWIFFAFIIILLIGMNHPPPLNDEGSLDLKRKLLFIVAVAILILCFIPYPILTL
ncbi:MAG: site-2 protease family protein [Thermoplasmata archaeon]|nr:MAG: site-2 protease family protein [Thermoplasmata archaeon]